MRLRVVVVGIPGVGKTTVVDKARAMVKDSKLVTFGTVMLEEGIRLRWIKHRDELRKLAVEKQRRLQSIAATKISKMKDKIIFIDTHLFIRTREGFWPGLPLKVVTLLKPTHLVLVEASPDEIFARREMDRTRYRDEVKHEELAGELSLARSFLAASSTLTGAPMLVVTNSDRRSDEVAAELAKVLSEAAA